MYKKITRQNIELYLGLISALLIPINKQWVVYSMFGWLLMTLTNIIVDRIRNQKIIIHKNTIFPILILPLLYILYIIGIGYSDNIEYGLFDLEVKFSMLLIPIIILLRNDLYKNQQRLFFSALIIGCTVSFFINISQASIAFLKDKSIDHFFYSSLSSSIHPSYLALYVSISLIAIIYYRQNILRIKHSSGLTITLFLLLLFYLIILSSKAGIISFAMVASLYASIRLAHRVKLIYAIISGIFILTIPFVIIKQIPSVNMRFTDMVNSLKGKEANIDSQHGSIARMAIIKSSWEMSINNLPWGVGTGDIKDEITKYYLDRGSKTIGIHYLNAHNQYAQTTITLGIPGITLLLGFFAFGLIAAYRKRQIVFFSFLILLFIHFLFESMLEQQAGVIFITLFYSFFCIWDNSKLNIQA